MDRDQVAIVRRLYEAFVGGTAAWEAGFAPATVLR